MFFAGNEDDSPVDEWLEARYESYTTPRDSDPEDESTDKEEDDEHKSYLNPPQASTVASSSDSSSESESQPQERKKCHKRRESDKLVKQFNSAIDKVESDQQAINAKIDRTNYYVEDLSANIKNLANKSLSSQNELRAEQRKNNSKFESLVESQSNTST